MNIKAVILKGEQTQLECSTRTGTLEYSRWSLHPKLKEIFSIDTKFLYGGDVADEMIELVSFIIWESTC